MFFEALRLVLKYSQRRMCSLLIVAQICGKFCILLICWCWFSAVKIRVKVEENNWNWFFLVCLYFVPSLYLYVFNLFVQAFFTAFLRVFFPVIKLDMYAVCDTLFALLWKVICSLFLVILMSEEICCIHVICVSVIYWSSYNIKYIVL